MDQTLICDGCGGQLAVDESAEIGTCIFCGRKKRLVEKTIVEHTGKVEVDGIATSSAKLTSAYQALKQTNLEKANKLYKEICDLEPENPYAWWGRYVCEYAFAEYYRFKDKYGNSGSDVKANILLECLQYADNAIQYADTDVKQIYIENSQSDRDFIEQVRNPKIQSENQNSQNQSDEKSRRKIVTIVVTVIIVLIAFSIIKGQ